MINIIHSYIRLKYNNIIIIILCCIKEVIIDYLQILMCYTSQAKQKNIAYPREIVF